MPGGGYGINGGSSLAAPQAAGLAAYLLTVQTPSDELRQRTLSLDMKALFRILGRRLRPNLPHIINNGIRDTFCGPETNVKGRGIIALDEPYYDRDILGSSGNESSPILDHAIRKVFSEGGKEESFPDSTAIPISLSLNQSSADDFFTSTPTMVKDLLGRFQPPPSSFFSTRHSTTTSARQKTTARPPPATNKPSIKVSVTALGPPSTSPSATSVDVNGIRITDFKGLDVSLTFYQESSLDNEILKEVYQC